MTGGCYSYKCAPHWNPHFNWCFPYNLMYTFTATATETYTATASVIPASIPSVSVTRTLTPSQTPLTTSTDTSNPTPRFLSLSWRLQLLRSLTAMISGMLTTVRARNTTESSAHHPILYVIALSFVVSTADATLSASLAFAITTNVLQDRTPPQCY